MKPWTSLITSLLCGALLVSCGDDSSPADGSAGGEIGGAPSGGTAASGAPTAAAGTATGGAGASNGGGAGGTSNTAGTSTGGTNTAGTSNIGGASTGGTSIGGAGAANAGTGGAAMAGSAGATPGGAGAGGGGVGGGGSGAAGDFCPASGPCKILPLGDSITDGLTTQGGYRIHLFELASAAGKNITFVGGSMNGPQMVAGKPFPRAHEGHSGWTISQIDGIVPKPALDVDPHIILLHIGTNDMSSMASQAPGRLETLLDQIIAAEPDALLVVATIIPLPFAANAVTSYNATIPAIVDERAKAGKHVILVDQFEGYPDGELPDNVHPSPKGYAYMAETWYAAISKYLR